MLGRKLRSEARMSEQTLRVSRSIDVSAAMLDSNGKPRPELFRWDGLHMNARGYAIWTSIIKPVLLSRFEAAPR